MSLFKFHDSNFLKGYNFPNVEASADTYNGYQFGISSGEATPFENATAAQAGDIYMMMNIIDKPEVVNTDDYKVVDGDKIRAIRLKDFIGQKIDISQDLVYFRDTGTAQVETATVVVPTVITTAGNASVVVTANGMTNSPKTVSVAVVAGTNQVETATVVGVIGAAGAGNASVVVTAAGMTGSPKTKSVAVANNDDAAAVAGKIRTELIADADIGHVDTGFFTVTGEGAEIILTAKTKAANDATLNVAIDNGTCTGLTAAPTSANTTAGVAADTANSVATKIRAALTADANIGHTSTGFFTVSGTNASVILTAKVATANDTTMNIAISDDTCDGITTAATSANTTAGKTPITTNALMWADITAGNYLVPRTTADTDYSMRWKKVSSVSGYEVYLVVKSKNTFGAFTVDKSTGDVLGGLVCEIMSTN